MFLEGLLVLMINEIHTAKAVLFQTLKIQKMMKKKVCLVLA